MRCQRLDVNGKRCGREAVYIEHYHGESELYNPLNRNAVGWVEIYLCGVHRLSTPDSECYIGKIKEKEP